MLNQLQPDAQAFNVSGDELQLLCRCASLRWVRACDSSAVFNLQGCVVRGGSAPTKASCITPNALRWIGTEMGAAPDPTWSTGFLKGGDPSSDMWCPAESDTTLQLAGESAIECAKFNLL